MNKLGRIFTIIFLLSSAIHAENAAVHPAQTDAAAIESAKAWYLDGSNDDSFETAKLESLVQATLTAQKSSVAKRATVGLLREIVKMGGFNILWKYHDSQSDIFHLILSSIICLPPIISDRFAGKLSVSRDKAIDALQKLERYVSRLYPEQKQALLPLFEQKYEALLNDKLALDKDSKKLQFARIVVMLIDLFWLFKRIIPELKKEIEILRPGGPVFNILHASRVPIMVDVIDPLTRRALRNPQTGQIVKYQAIDQSGELMFRDEPVVQPFPSLTHIHKTATASLLILVVADALQVISNFVNSPDRQKACILKKIKAELMCN